jgi:hypothetical protein
LELLEAGLGEKNSCRNAFSTRETGWRGSSTLPRRAK